MPNIIAAKISRFTGDCCIVDDLDGISLEQIENMEFDPSLLEENNIPRTTDSAGKESEKAKGVHRRAPPLMRDGDPGNRIKTGSSDSDSGSEEVPQSERPIMHRYDRGDSAASNHRAEPLDNRWNDIVRLSTNQKTDRDQPAYGDPAYDYDNQTTQKHIPPHREDRHRAVRPYIGLTDDASADADKCTNVAANASSNSKSIPKSVGTEIYADPKRLITYLVEIYGILDGMNEIVSIVTF